MFHYIVSYAKDVASEWNGYFLKPERFGKHEIIAHLATGGMAQLYLARVSGIEGFAKLVVVKLMRSELAVREQLVSMFLDEARLAATLHHPNIGQVYDIGEAEGRYFFTMEFIHGADLANIMRTLHSRARELPVEHA